MTTEKDPRSTLGEARRVVVKIGSRAILGDDLSAPRFEPLAAQIGGLRQRGHTPLLVSSGAVAMGFRRLGFDERPTAMSQLQASAAVGQSRLIQRWEEAFAPHGLPVAQVLITHEGMAYRDRYLNARATLEALLGHEAVPIINENDTVSVEEIRFGDNDRLAALVAALVHADLLILLTNVPGLLDAEGRRVSVVRDPDEVRSLVRADQDAVSLGGMASKLDSADMAGRRGTPTVIASASDPGVLERILDGQDVGTLLLPRGVALASRKHWIVYALKPRGTLTVDQGAADALRHAKRSLLPAGVVAVDGTFRAGEAVRIAGPGGEELARGLVRYDARDLARLMGAQTDDIERRVGHYAGDAVVHRDDLVMVAEA